MGTDMAMKAAFQRREPDESQAHAVRLAGFDIDLLPQGAAFLRDERMLVVADLHLGKGLTFAAGGQMLPPYDSCDTMDRLTALVRAIGPDSVVLLGDSIHRQSLQEASLAPVLPAIEAIAREAELIWITGNHDPAPAGVAGTVREEIRLGERLILRHEPGHDGLCEMVGHLHPAARLPTRAGRVRRRCFVASDSRILLPAFGAMTGTICVSEPVIADLFPGGKGRAFLLLGRQLAEVPLAALAS